jgi:hypothetical protein
VTVTDSDRDRDGPVTPAVTPTAGPYKLVRSRSPGAPGRRTGFKFSLRLTPTRHGDGATPRPGPGPARPASVTVTATADSDVTR